MSKNEKEKKKQVAAMIVNLIIVLMEVIGLILSVQTNGLSLFQFYTVDSNILAMLACAAFAIYTIILMRGGNTLMPEWVIRAKYMATCCLAVTFFVVIFVLSLLPDSPGLYYLMTSDSMLYHHFLCPILALGSWIFLEDKPVLTQKHTRLALLPTILYASVTVALNISKLIVGPYPFLYVYEQPVFISVVWGAVILTIAYLLAWMIRRVTNLIRI